MHPMNPLRTSHYDKVARQGQFLGATVLRLPWLSLWTWVVNVFHSELIQYLTSGPPVTDPSRSLEEAGLKTAVLDLSQAFEGYQSAVPRLKWTRQGLMQLADACDDYARDDGAWLQRHTQELEMPKAEAFSALEKAALRLKDRVARANGIDQAVAILHHLSDRVKTSAANPQALRPWTPHAAQELREHAQTLRTLANPRGLWGLVARLRPQTSARLFLTEAQRGTIARGIYPALQYAALKRYTDLVRRAHEDIRRRFLGDPPDNKGVIGTLLAALETQRAFFQKLAPDPVPDVVADAAPHEIILVANLQVVIDATTRTRVRTLFDNALRQAGCSAQGLANKLLRGGLVHGDRVYRPAEWYKLNPAAVRNELARLVRRYLGADQAGTPIDWQNPHSAFAHAAQITLVHPALQNLLKGVLADWVRKSTPYGELSPLPNIQRRGHVLLYCYPPDRQTFERLLETVVTLNNSQHEAGAYCTGNPYVAMLCQYQLAEPLSYLRHLPKWYKHSNGVATHLDRGVYPEFRRLSQRPAEWEDAQALFTSACQLGIVRPHSGDGFVLATPHPELDALFAPPVPCAVWKPAKTFQQLLGRPEFQRVLETALPKGTQPAPADLARQEPDSVARHLVLHGILEAGPAGLYRYAGQPAGDITRDLFVWKIGSLAGLAPDEFVGQMLRPEAHEALATCNTFWGMLMGHLRNFAESSNPAPAFR
jgi:hypothetical protein